jgi:glutamyl endopeptidase
VLPKTKETLRTIVEPETSVARAGGEPVDTRELVDPRYLDELPFSSIGHLLVTLTSGAQQTGTGFLIHERVILTAAHVLHSSDGIAGVSVVFTSSCKVRTPDSPLMTRVSVSLGSDRFRVSSAWRTGDRSIGADYGAIVLRSDALVGCRHLFVAPIEETFVLRQAMSGAAEFIVSGFPSDKPRGTQWVGRGRLVESPLHAVNHMIDTFRGESGAPLVAAILDPNSGKRVPMAIGIHSRAADDDRLNYNQARTIDASLLKDIGQWLEELSN